MYMTVDILIPFIIGRVGLVQSFLIYGSPAAGEKESSIVIGASMGSRRRLRSGIQKGSKPAVKGVCWQSSSAFNSQLRCPGCSTGLNVIPRLDTSRICGIAILNVVDKLNLGNVDVIDAGLESFLFGFKQMISFGLV